MFDNETNDYALSDCVWWDHAVILRPFWAKADCAGRVGDTEHGILCETHYNAIPQENRTEYVTWVTGIEQYRGDDLEDAIRAWDGNPSVFGGGITPGGISVQTWENGLMVRDGWILHVYDNGQVFLNPNIR